MEASFSAARQSSGHSTILLGAAFLFIEMSGCYRASQPLLDNGDAGSAARRLQTAGDTPADAGPSFDGGDCDTSTDIAGTWVPQGARPSPPATPSCQFPIMDERGMRFSGALQLYSDGGFQAQFATSGLARMTLPSACSPDAGACPAQLLQTPPDQAQCVFSSDGCVCVIAATSEPALFTGSYRREGTDLILDLDPAFDGGPREQQRSGFCVSGNRAYWQFSRSTNPVKDRVWTLSGLDLVRR